MNTKHFPANVYLGREVTAQHIHTRYVLSDDHARSGLVIYQLGLKLGKNDTLLRHGIVLLIRAQLIQLD